MPRALTLPELIFLNQLRARERQQKESQHMVAKVKALDQLVGLADEFNHPGFDDLAERLTRATERVRGGRMRLTETVNNAEHAADALDRLNGAFGNGAPADQKNP
jgi:hypothetical protein